MLTIDSHAIHQTVHSNQRGKARCIYNVKTTYHAIDVCHAHEKVF